MTHRATQHKQISTTASFEHPTEMKQKKTTYKITLGNIQDPQKGNENFLKEVEENKNKKI